VKDGTAELADPNSTEAKLIVKFSDPGKFKYFISLIIIIIIIISSLIKQRS